MMRWTHNLWRLWMPGVVLLAVSCSTIPKDFEPPRVNISDMTPKDVALFEQRFDVKVRIQNPNTMDISVNGLRFDIELNDKEFANGMSGQQVTVPRFGSETVNVEVITTLGSFLRQVQALNAAEGSKVRYHLKGTAFVVSPSQFKTPFDEKGDIDINFASQAEKEPPP